jgi:hypothetical protein
VWVILRSFRAVYYIALNGRPIDELLGKRQFELNIGIYL